MKKRDFIIATKKEYDRLSVVKKHALSDINKWYAIGGLSVLENILDTLLPDMDFSILEEGSSNILSDFLEGE